MTRKEKALLSEDNREANGNIETQYSDGTWATCCPFYIDCGEDDFDDGTQIITRKEIVGCRGILCVECWAKEFNESTQ